MEIRIADDKVVVKVRVSTVILTLFVLYCIFEVLRIAYIGGLEALPASVWLLVLGVIVVVGLRKCLARNKAVASECGYLFSTKLTKIVIAFHVASIGLILFATIALLADFPSFLIVQLLLLASLWLDNRRLNVSLNMLRASFVFTVIYVSYVLLLTRNMVMEFMALLYFTTWLCLLTKIEISTLRECVNEVRTDREFFSEENEIL